MRIRLKQSRGEWLALQERNWRRPRSQGRVDLRDAWCFRISLTSLAKLGPWMLLKVLKRIEGRGIHETAHRTRQRCAQVFRYACKRGAPSATDRRS